MMNIENTLKDLANSTQLHITDIRCYCTKSNKGQDWHSHCMWLLRDKTYCYRRHTHWGLSDDTCHSLVVYIDGICCQCYWGRILHDTGYRMLVSYSKYILIMLTHNICMYYQYEGSNQLNIVSIVCYWDNADIQGCYQSRSNIYEWWYRDSNCLGILYRLMKSCKVGSLGC